MQSNIIISVTILSAILWLIYDILQNRKNMKELDAANRDLHIEFGSNEGEGIELVKKQYPDLELRDDHRTGIEDANES